MDRSNNSSMAEIIVKLVREVERYKVLELAHQCKTKEELEEKIRAMIGT